MKSPSIFFEETSHISCLWKLQFQVMAHGKEAINMTVMQSKPTHPSTP